MRIFLAVLVAAMRETGRNGPVQEGHLLDALRRAYELLGFGRASGGTTCSGSWY